jgi:hypothetical protein
MAVVETIPGGVAHAALMLSCVTDDDVALATTARKKFPAFVGTPDVMDGVVPLPLPVLPPCTEADCKPTT